jgi:hypothetical protein
MYTIPVKSTPVPSADVATISPPYSTYPYSRLARSLASTPV